VIRSIINRLLKKRDKQKSLKEVEGSNKYKPLSYFLGSNVFLTTVLLFFRKLNYPTINDSQNHTCFTANKMYNCQLVAYPYALMVFLILAMQSLLATGGSLHLIFPDIPSPIESTYGRAIHLNISIFWPLLGTMGSIYYFFIEITGKELYSRRLANLGFWYFILVFFAILISLALGEIDGREYFEAPPFLRVGFFLGVFIFAYNLVATAVINRIFFRLEVVFILSGIILSIILYIPNLFFIYHPTIDDIFRFLVVHLWEEGSLELLVVMISSTLLASMDIVERGFLKKLVYWEVVLVLISGIFATGHHYYWIGTLPLWQTIGAIASGLQVIPIILLGFTAWKSVKNNKQQKFNPALYFFYSAVVWNGIGAGIIGFLIAIPAINRYTHGTYFVSAHAHMALFGFFGFMVLATCYFILTRYSNLTSTHVFRIKLSVLLLNIGLALMAVNLIIAGFKQSYLWRFLGADFMEVHMDLFPYLLLRVAGGVVFASGSLLLAWEILNIFFSPLVTMKNILDDL